MKTYKQKSQFMPIYQEIRHSVFKMKTSSGDLLHDFLLGKQIKAQDEALGLTDS